MQSTSSNDEIHAHCTKLGGSNIGYVMASPNIPNLPLELLHHLLSFLPLPSIHILGATCRDLHRLIHLDNHLWKIKVLEGLKLGLVSREICADEQEMKEWNNLDGLIRDPTLQGFKEVFVLYSPEFKKILKDRRDQASQESELERLIRPFLPRFLQRTTGLVDFRASPRVALFGPGIESTNTKHLVHRIINSHTSIFDAREFISGLPGGFGSGVRIDFCKTFQFDLMCLYTNSARVREADSHRGAKRLLASNNKLLANDIEIQDIEVDCDEQIQDDNGNKAPMLHPNVLKLLPTIDALVFSLDGTELEQMQDDLQQREQFLFLKSELNILMTALKNSEKHVPILILSCYNGIPEEPEISVRKIADELDLVNKVKADRPWAVFNIDIKNMNGMVKALDWLLYHFQKRRSNLEYHQLHSEKQFL